MKLEGRYSVSILALVTLITLLMLTACGTDAESPGGDLQDTSVENDRQLDDVIAPPPAPETLTGVLNETIDRLDLSWSYNLGGDYNLDGEVSGLDVFPLASRFGQDSNYNGHTATTDGNDCIDGNQDGTLSGLDLFVCAANFQRNLVGYSVYVDTQEDGGFANRITAVPVGAQPSPCGNIQTTHVAFDPADGWYYAVRAFDDLSTEGPRSDSFKPHYWQIETIDAEGRVGEFSSLAFQPIGYPGIAYFDGTNNDLKFTMHTGTDWVIFSVDTAGYVGEFCSLAFDSNNFPAISYQDNDNVSLKFARHDGTSWQIETVDPGGNLGEYTSLAFSPAGEPAISYIDRGSADLKLARFNGTAWDIETVDGFANAEYDTTLAFAPDGDTVICYYEGNPTYGPKYARYHDSLWQTSWLGSQFGYQPSMAIGADGNPSIVCYTQMDLKYTHHDGTSWQTEVVESPAVPMQHPSLAFDSQGYPAVAYYVQSPFFELRLARYTGSEWEIAVIDDGDDGNVGQFSSIAFGNDGQPAISYYDGQNLDLKFARYR